LFIKDEEKDEEYGWAVSLAKGIKDPRILSETLVDIIEAAATYIGTEREPGLAQQVKAAWEETVQQQS